MILLIQALLVGTALAFQKWGNWFGSLGFDRPILAGALMGLLLGSLRTGIIVGAALELVYLGSVTLGGTIAFDIGMGTVMSTAFAILGPLPLGVTVLLSFPVSLLGAVVYPVFKKWSTSLVPRFQDELKAHQIQAFNRLWHRQWLAYLGFWFLVGTGLTLLGAPLCRLLVPVLPAPLVHILAVGAGMLPAMGIAAMLISLWNSELIPWFFLGFALVAFFKGSMIEVAFIASVIAALMAGNAWHHRQPPKAKSVEDDFLDD
ncbi:PTS sugar transporter subunit IIC [Schleiferilactobacillus harbinensis]|jgi:PTS system mannose-specific IIC component|uniref:PTS sugar transporter subunit IIC n=1 Tax=Schleiferilactobacillus harbinensis TaxID=304207 RepID=UPI00242D3FE6|nr:PTS sugar transporter subunit IIC [Schleiferilactobacillus harbinensis]MCI1687352.1 PTS sugar transporter subunit IIC [Schleiferilactobacillus harbinensis]MCI1783698.1 PTS sugar transporter subunit IIC [Schleiferilactobacillus harbinensis]MCI1851545.1 PTS sugar transporter subunit IIC [Schleiferilactobacillus harbinensis]